MFAVTWRKALVAPTVVALAFGGALLTGSAAQAAPVAVAFAVTSPTSGTPYDNTATPDSITFTGVGLPTGDTVGITYSGTAAPAPSTATVTPPTIDGAAWSVTATLPDNGPGSTGVEAQVTALKAGVADPDAAPVTSNFVTTTPLVPANFALVTPAVGVTQASPTVTFAGTGASSAIVTVTYTGKNGTPEGGSFDTTATGDYSFGVDFSKMPVGATSTTVTVTDEGENAQPFPGTTPITRTVTFAKAPNPGAPTASVIPIVTTLDKATVQGLQLNASNFTPGEPLTVTMKDVTSGRTVAITQSSAAPAADTAGALTEQLTLPASTTGYDFEVTVTGTTSGDTAVAPVALLGDPTITAPTEAEKLVGSTVTFSGTGTPGSNIVLVYGPTAEIKAQLEKTETAMKRAQAGTRLAPKASAPQASSPTDPAAATDPIIVGTDGTWSVTLKAEPGAYTVLAAGALLDADGNVLLDQDGDPLITNPTTPVDFTLAAAVTTTSSTGQTLAFTGSSDALPAGIGGGVLLLAGLALTIAARRRRAVR